MKHRGRLVVFFCAAAALASAQRYGRGFWGGESPVGPGVRTAREIPSHSTGTPVWENPKGFEQDVFTFTRVRYTSGRRGYYGRRSGSWSTDCPDSDLNLSYRLQQMTSIKCSPDGRILELTDEDLAAQPPDHHKNHEHQHDGGAGDDIQDAPRCLARALRLDQSAQIGRVAEGLAEVGTHHDQIRQAEQDQSKPA